MLNEYETGKNYNEIFISGRVKHFLEMLFNYFSTADTSIKVLKHFSSLEINFAEHYQLFDMQIICVNQNIKLWKTL